MSNPNTLPTLPKRSTGWKRGTIELSTREGKAEVPGLTKGDYGVSLGEDGNGGHRLTQLRSGCAAFFGPQGVCRRVGDAFAEHVPSLGELPTSDTSRLPKDELAKLHHLLRLARLA
jgi:hypothetical protein